MNKRDCFFYDEIQDMNATVPRCKYYDTWGMSCNGCPKYFEKQVGINIIKSYVDKYYADGKLNKEDFFSFFASSSLNTRYPSPPDGKATCHPCF